MYIILAIIFFGILIAIHEFGHFSAAKLLGVKVNEFAIGMGPAIFKKRKGETLYSLRCLPIGGYCALEGEDEDTGDERAFMAKPVWKKLIILAAGSFMNFLLGLALVLMIFSQAWGFNATLVAEVSPESSFYGVVEPGDLLYSIDGHRTWFTADIELFLQRNTTGVYDIVVERGGEKLERTDVEIAPYDDGSGNMVYGFSFRVEKATFWNRIQYAWYNCMDFVRMVYLSLADLVRGLVGLDDMTGVVGIVDMINDVGSETAAEEGMFNALLDVANLVAFIAVNLAVMNLLPIPGLDGGRIFFVLLGAIVKLFNHRGIPSRLEGWVNAAGLVAMLALMAVIMFNDISRLIK